MKFVFNSTEVRIIFKCDWMIMDAISLCSTTVPKVLPAYFFIFEQSNIYIITYNWDSLTGNGAIRF